MLGRRGPASESRAPLDVPQHGSGSPGGSGWLALGAGLLSLPWRPHVVVTALMGPWLPLRCPHHTGDIYSSEFRNVPDVLTGHCPVLSGRTPSLGLSTRCHGLTISDSQWSSGVCMARGWAHSPSGPFLFLEAFL